MILMVGISIPAYGADEGFIFGYRLYIGAEVQAHSVEMVPKKEYLYHGDKYLLPKSTFIYFK